VVILVRYFVARRQPRAACRRLSYFGPPLSQYGGSSRFSWFFSVDTIRERSGGCFMATSPEIFWLKISLFNICVCAAGKTVDLI
jgi:hypothetical protein